MKKLTFIFIALIALAFASCSRVPPGYTGLKVSLLGTDRGSIEELDTGRYYIGVGKELHTFPTFNQNYVWTETATEGSEEDESFTFPVEGMRIGVDVGIEYYLEAGRIQDIFVEYRKGVDELTDITIRNVVRDSLNNFAADYTVDDLVSGGMGNLMDSVEQYTREYFAPVGINIKSLSLVTAPRYPASVTNAIEAKNRATQVAIQRENELRQTEAQVAMEIAQTEGNAARRVLDATANAEVRIVNAEATATAILTEARAQADANLLLSRSLTPAVLEAKRLEEWNGVYPQYMLGDSANVLLGLD